MIAKIGISFPSVETDWIQIPNLVDRIWAAEMTNMIRMAVSLISNRSMGIK